MSAIPTILEKLVLQGKAQFRVMNHAFGSFGRIMLPNESFAVITKIIWYPFLQAFDEDITNLSYADYFQYNEWQLKIDGKKSLNYYQFRNNLEYYITDPTYKFKLSDAVVESDLNDYFLFKQGNPIIIDTYLVCQDYIKLTITRNIQAVSVGGLFTQLNASANEPTPPNGVGGQNVLLTNTFRCPPPVGGNRFVYMPPYRQYAGNPAIANPRVMENYTQDIIPQAQVSPTSNGSLLAPPNVFNYFIYQKYPLINFHYVVVNRNDWNNLMNS